MRTKRDSKRDTATAKGPTKPTASRKSRVTKAKKAKATKKARTKGGRGVIAVEPVATPVSAESSVTQSASTVPASSRPAADPKGDGAREGVEKPAPGRPSIATPELKAEIIRRIEEDGLSLRAVLRMEDMPCRRTVDLWMAADAEFLGQYTRAREIRAELLEERMREIADEPVNKVATQFGEHMDSAHVAKQKLQIETLRWSMARMAPKTYGDKVTQEHVGPEGGPVQVQQIEAPDHMKIREKYAQRHGARA